MSPTRCPKRGFSLTELLLAIAVVLVILMLGGALFGNLRKIGADARCLQNLRQIGAATTGYISENNGWLPVALERTPRGSGWDMPATGAWYWNLAPYLGVPRWTSVTKYIGPERKHLYQPVVFTCPAHGENEPNPIRFPSVHPVSYAPNTRMSPGGDESYSIGEVSVSRLRISNVVSLPQKIWVSDSTHPSILNISAARWPREREESQAWPRVSFSRHNGAGNALFFDGHVERITYESIMSGNFSDNVTRLFDPDAP